MLVLMILEATMQLEISAAGVMKDLHGLIS